MTDARAKGFPRASAWSGLGPTEDVEMLSR